MGIGFASELWPFKFHLCDALDLWICTGLPPNRNYKPICVESVHIYPVVLSESDPVFPELKPDVKTVSFSTSFDALHNSAAGSIRRIRRRRGGGAGEASGRLHELRGC